jgi:hypothetical protein
MSQETPSGDIQRIPLKERNLLQYFVAQSFGEKPADETNDVWLEKTLRWTKAVSDIIDNTENKNIRDLTISGKYEEAAKLVVEMLNISEQENSKKYAKLV